MKNRSFIYILILGVIFLMPACDLVDVTEDPVNPNLSENSVLGVPNSSVQWLDGLERQMANVYNEVLTITAIASDNYTNTQTFFNQFLDKLDIVKVDRDINDLQFDIHRLRELAIFGLEKVGPADENYTSATEAEYHFFKGMAFLLGGELFGSLPGEPGGAPLAAPAHLNAAVTSFDDALRVAAAGSETETSALLARARAKYHLGDKGGASTDAQSAITSNASFLRQTEFDFNEGPTNTMQDALWDRATFDDLQPLPRLDFLDPKYSLIGGTQESPVAMLKIEEAHLILCEAAIADNQLPKAQGIMKDIIGLVGTRELRATDEGAEGRTHDAPGSRPDSTDVLVAASPGAPLRPGLVLDRGVGAPLAMVPAVSGTSVTETMVDMVSTEDEALALLYLMRQEIFIAEGRRMTDLGIRFVISETEQLRNENINDGDPSTIKDLPSFISDLLSTSLTALDEFTYDPVTRECVITNDLNSILVANKSSDRVLPFH